MLAELKSKFLEQKRRPAAKNVGGKSTLHFDLLYQLSYMSVIAAAGVPRKQIFERSAELPCASAEYFKRVELMCRRLKYDYAKACRVVGESTREEEVKGLLLRFSSSLSSGEPEADFLSREAEAQAKAYDSDYGSKIESMKMWTDAYVSLILSAVLIIIIGIVSTLVWEIDTAFILGLVVVSLMTTALGVWLIYLMSPREVVVVRQAGSREQRLTRKMFRMIMPIGVAVCAVLVMRGTNLGWGMIAAAAALFPVGWVSVLDDKKVAQRDSEVGSFLGSLGGVCAAIGTTVKEALGRIDLDAIAVLRREVKRLHARLYFGLGTRLCWREFIKETGSELTNRSVGMFYDAIDLGGDPQQAGYRASLFASKISVLRSKRKTVSSPFRWLCITMHASVVALLVFITEVMAIFGNMLYEATREMPNISGSVAATGLTSFNFQGLELLRTMLMPLVIVFTVSDAIAPSIADGGSRYKVLYNLGITAGITGVSLLGLPSLAGILFNSVQM